GTADGGRDPRGCEGCDARRAEAGRGRAPPSAGCQAGGGRRRPRRRRARPEGRGAHRTDRSAAPGRRAGAAVHRVASAGDRGRRPRPQLVSRRLDRDGAAGKDPRGRAPPARRAGCALRLPLGSDRDRLAAPHHGRAVRRRVHAVLDAAAPSREAEGEGRRRAAARVGDGDLARGELARARDLRHVRRQLHRTSRPAPHPDARGLAGIPAAQGLSARGAGRAADGEPARLAETPSGERRSRDRMSTERAVHHGAMFDTDELVINMGPQHPSTHGVLRVVLRLDGEKVVDCDVVIGYLHRGIEKLSENRNWTQIVLLTDRMDYVAAATSNVGYCETVEKLLQLEVPRRARYVRTILMELQRIASHCLWVGTHAMDIGAMTVFLYAFRERELILDLFEEFCGARLTYNSMRIGGLPQDIPPGWDKKVLEFCDIMAQKLDEYEELLTHNRIWLERTKGIGVISGPEAIALGMCGPPLRGSGVARDVRKDEPYAAYDEMEFDVPIGTACDTYDRYLVRMEEFRQSLRIIRQATQGIPEGPIVGKVPRLIKPAAGETYHAIESPKGELGYFIVSDGKSTNPYRFRVRPPSFCNLQGLRRLVRGHLVADVVALIGSIDIVLGEVDRRSTSSSSRC